MIRLNKHMTITIRDGDSSLISIRDYLFHPNTQVCRHILRVELDGLS